jgi:beta-phosphoglucomutase-like phosphatase (HAD superfamily)
MLLIFDIDGTICNTKLVSDNCFIKTFETMYNCHLANIEWETFTNVTDNGLYNDLFFQYNKKLPNNIEKTKFETLYKSNLIKEFSKNTSYEVEGTKQFISFCKNKNICISIATGNWRSISELKMKYRF